MQTVVDIATVIALCSVSALCLYAIAALKDVREALKELREQFQTLNRTLAALPADFKDIRQQISRILGHVEDATRHSALITQKLNDDVQGSTGVFAEVEALRLQLKRLRDFIETNIIRPAQQIATFIAATTQGAMAFMQTLQQRPTHTPEQRSVDN
jgi:uncharacterized protein YoxC